MYILKSPFVLIRIIISEMPEIIFVLIALFRCHDNTLQCQLRIYGVHFSHENRQVETGNPTDKKKEGNVRFGVILHPRDSFKG